MTKKAREVQLGRAECYKRNSPERTDDGSVPIVTEGRTVETYCGFGLSSVGLDESEGGHASASLRRNVCFNRRWHCPRVRTVRIGLRHSTKTNQQPAVDGPEGFRPMIVVVAYLSDGIGEFIIGCSARRVEKARGRGSRRQEEGDEVCAVTWIRASFLPSFLSLNRQLHHQTRVS